MKILFYLILFNLTYSYYSIIQSDSKVEYSGRHPIHAFTGKSSSIMLLSDCDSSGDKCDLKFTVPVISLNSGNDNRDSNMLNYLEAFSYSGIILNIEDFMIMEYDSKSISCAITIHGVTQTIDIPLTVKQKSPNQYRASSTFSILLEEFDIPRPKLLFIPIDNEIRIKVDLLIKGEEL